MSAAVERRLGLAPAVALVVGNVVGSGIYLLPASLAPYGWNGVAAWVLTSLGALLIATVLGKLSAARPDDGGPVGSVERAFGPLAGALIGWCSWVSWWTGSATVAIAAGSYLSAFVPALAAPGIAALTAIALIVLLTLVNLAGARFAGGTQLVSTIIKLVPLVAVVVLLAVLAPQGRMPLAPPPPRFDIAQVNAAAALTLWALVGFESAGLASDKLRRPERDVLRSTLGGTALSAILYLVVSSAVVLALPPATLARSDAPFALFFETYWSRKAGLAVAAFAAISCLGALNGFILVAGEVPLAMARTGALPAWFGATRSDGTPARMLIVSSTLAALLVAANVNQTTGALFTWSALLATSASLWLYFGLTLAAVRLAVVRLLALAGAGYAAWTLWGAGSASLLSLALMLTVLPFHLSARRAARQQPA